MCGIVGIIGSSLPRDQAESRATAMRDRLRHRGPDDEGVFYDLHGQCVLAHARLSILDLSEAGHQPMSTPDGRYTIVFNGEIYNFLELRAELEAAGLSFKSHSDTEVVLRLFERSGASAVDRLQGMFAFAVWDAAENRCFLARDPLGIKPLYFWHVGRTLAFASELRAVLVAGIGTKEIDTEAMTQYLMFGSVQEPQTLVENVDMLPAGHTLEWSAGSFTITPYWDLSYRAGPCDLDASVKQTRAALDDSVRRHFVSDVPVGIFLSGGIDSTALVALAKSNGYEQLQTFSISFDEHAFNEGDAASRTARHFGTEHHDWRMTAADGKALFADFLESMDQPSNDGFNTFCVAKFARDCGMKVVLSGLGGDELFGSYPSFSKVPQLMRWQRRLGVLRKPIARVLSRVPAGWRWKGKADRLASFLRSPGDAISAYWTVRAFFTPTEAVGLVDYLAGGSRRKGGGGLLPERSAGCFAQEPPAPFSSAGFPDCPTVKDTVAYLEATRYMRNQLLRDSDVFSMAHGLELRVPLVDRCLFQVVNGIPSSLRHSAGKQMLLDAVPEIPHWVANSKKMGFRFPFERWLAADWKTAFEELERTVPVRLGTWYRKWTLLTLKHFLASNGLSHCE